MTDKKKKKKFSLRKLIYNDKYLIILSIVSALIIWVATSINVSPETTKKVSVNLPVDVSGSAQEQLGLKTFGDKNVNVEVTIVAKKYIIREITDKDLVVSLDTSTVTSAGYHSLPISVKRNDRLDFTIDSYSPSTYNAYFDVEQENVFEIKVNLPSENYIEEGYVAGETVLSDTSAVVSGPASYVSRVDSVQANVSFDNKLTTTQTVDLNLKAYDKSGKTVEFVSIETKNSAPTITVPVLKKMKLPVSVSITGMPQGVSESDFDIYYSAAEMSVGMLESAASSINSVNLGEISFSSLKTGSNKFTFRTDSINGITVLDENLNSVEVIVTIPKSFKTKTYKISKNDIKLNLPDGYEATVNSIDFDKVTLVGTNAELGSIKANAIAMSVDFSENDEIKTGTDVYTVSVSIPKSNTVWVYGSYKATLTITKM